VRLLDLVRTLRESSARVTLDGLESLLALARVRVERLVLGPHHWTATITYDGGAITYEGMGRTIASALADACRVASQCGADRRAS
jgi:hypothetical protein